MDIETFSLIIVMSINVAILFGIIFYFSFFYKWDSKVYDDMGENLEQYRRQGYNNSLFFPEGGSNIESLLAKEDTIGQFTINQGARALDRRESQIPLDLSSLPSRIGSFHRNSVFTMDRGHSIAQFASRHYMPSQDSGIHNMSYFYMGIIIFKNKIEFGDL